MLEAWMALALACSTLVTLSLNELALFVFKILPSFAYVLTSSCGELTWVRLLSSFVLLWHRLMASLLEFHFFQALLYLDIVLWRAYLSFTFFKLCSTLTSSLVSLLELELSHFFGVSTFLTPSKMWTFLDFIFSMCLVSSEMDGLWMFECRLMDFIILIALCRRPILSGLLVSF